MAVYNIKWELQTFGIGYIGGGIIEFHHAMNREWWTVENIPPGPMLDTWTHVRYGTRTTFLPDIQGSTLALA